MRNSNHPWRQNISRLPTIDPIVGSRSSQFAAYLETLSRDERKLIEAAERQFVARSNGATDRRQSTARDYACGMLGVKENEPAQYRGFVA
jgi:hypothetical protein